MVLVKWRLLLTTLPLVAAVLGLKLAIEHWLGFQGLLDFSDMTLVLTGGTFLVGFMLSGTLSDYKEAEKIPAEIACLLETIEESFVQASLAKSSLDLTAQRKAIHQAGNAIIDWLYRRSSHAEMFTSLEKLGDHILEMDRHGAPALAARSLRELHNLRRFTTRIGVISRTGFIAAGYALLEVLVVTILGMTVLARFKNLVSEVVLVAFVSLIFIYMLRLIRDLDDPFDYDTTGPIGAAEVELFPLKEYLDRLGARVG